MKSLNQNRGLKPNGLRSDDSCRASAENKKLALLEDQVDKLQIDLDILAKEVKDFGSSFNTASAHITKLEANNATVKGTLTAKNLTSENTSTKAIIKQFQQKNASASCIVGQSAKKEADLDIVVIKNGISQYVKLHLNGTTVISQGAGADYITDFRVYENGTAEVLFSDTADIMVYSESSDFTAFKGTTSGPYKSIPVNNEITLSGKLNIDNEEVISFNNVDIKSLTVNELTSLDLINAIRLSATELHADAATILDATIEVLKAQQIDTTELHATNGVVDTLNVTNLNVDATCSAGNINSSGTIKAEAFEALKGIRAEDIKMDKKLQLPVITNTDYTDIEMPVKSGMVFGMIIDEATKECLASFTLIKNTTKFSNVLFCYSQKELHNILSVHEDEDKDFILRTKLSGKTLVYGLVSNEDMLTFEAVVNSARPMKINHDITYLQHTLIMGDKSLAFGLEIDGELKAALIPLPGTSAFNDIVISNTLAVGKEVNFGTEALDAVFNMYGISTFNGAVNIDGKTTIGASDKPQDLEVNGSTTLNGITVIDGNTTIGSDTSPADLTVTGNIYQKGKAYETHVQQLKTTKDWIITRQPEKADDPTPPLAPGEMSGIKAIAYDDEGNNGILGFDKTGTARVGDEGKEQAIATRAEEAEMVNGNIVAWNGTDKKLVTPKAAIVDGHTLAKTDDALMLYGSEGMDNIPEGSLDDVVKCGQYSADDGLADKITEKPAAETGAFDLIVGYFNTDSTLPYQIYTSKGKQKAYYRMTVDGMYGEWKQLTDKAEVKDLIKNGTVENANNALTVAPLGTICNRSTEQVYKIDLDLLEGVSNISKSSVKIELYERAGGYVSIVGNGSSRYAYEPDNLFTCVRVPSGRKASPGVKGIFYKINPSNTNKVTIYFKFSGDYSQDYVVLSSYGGKVEDVKIKEAKLDEINGAIEVPIQENITDNSLFNPNFISASTAASQNDWYLLFERKYEAFTHASSKYDFRFEGMIGRYGSTQKCYISLVGDMRNGKSSANLYGTYYTNDATPVDFTKSTIEVWWEGNIVRYYWHSKYPYESINGMGAPNMQCTKVDAPKGEKYLAIGDENCQVHEAATTKDCLTFEDKYITTLTGTIDFNNLVDGVYEVANSQYDAALNKPPVKTAYYVISLSSGSGCQRQVAFSRDDGGIIFTRIRFGSDSWRGWSRALTNDNGWDFYGGTTLPPKVDLNTITQIGTWSTTTDNPDTNPINTPPNMQRGGTLRVFASLGEQSSLHYITQEWVDYLHAGEIARRVTSDGGATWTHWFIFQGTDSGA